MNILYRLFQAVSILAMLFFSIPKLIAQKSSVKGFTQFAQVLPIDPYLFMYITGVIELSIVILLVISLVAEFKKPTGYLKHASMPAFFLLLGTMMGALSIEFFVRPTPEYLLVVIALILTIGSAVSIYHKKDLFGNV